MLSDAERMRQWRAANPERSRATSQRWSNANPEKVRALWRRKRARRRRAAEIEAAKQILLSAHRLRVIGVTPQRLGAWYPNYGFDSWSKEEV